MKITAFFLVILLLTGCTNQFSYKPLSEFTIQQDALKNKAEVEFIYVSGGPNTPKKGQDFLYQYLVIDKATGNTVRVLSPDLLSFGQSGTMNYISVESETAIDRLVLRNLGYRKGQYKRVICNNEFADAESKDCPTVIGYFGYVSGTDPDPETDQAVGAFMDSIQEQESQK